MQELQLRMNLNSRPEYFRSPSAAKRSYSFEIQYKRGTSNAANSMFQRRE
jgi:hypothetical protein